MPLVLSEQTHTVKSCPTLANPWTVAHQAPLSIGVQSTNLPHAKQMPDWQREKNFFSPLLLTKTRGKMLQMQRLEGKNNDLGARRTKKKGVVY